MTTPIYEVGTRVISRAAVRGLEVGGVYTVLATFYRLRSGGAVHTITIELGTAEVEIEHPASVLWPAVIEARGYRGPQCAPWRDRFRDLTDMVTWCGDAQATVVEAYYVEA